MIVGGAEAVQTRIGLWLAGSVLLHALAVPLLEPAAGTTGGGTGGELRVRLSAPASGRPGSTADSEPATSASSPRHQESREHAARQATELAATATDAGQQLIAPADDAAPTVVALAVGPPQPVAPSEAEPSAAAALPSTHPVSSTAPVSASPPQRHDTGIPAPPDPTPAAATGAAPPTTSRLPVPLPASRLAEASVAASVRTPPIETLPVARAGPVTVVTDAVPGASSEPPAATVPETIPTPRPPAPAAGSSGAASPAEATVGTTVGAGDRPGPLAALPVDRRESIAPAAPTARMVARSSDPPRAGNALGDMPDTARNAATSTTPRDITQASGTAGPVGALAAVSAGVAAQPAASGQAAGDNEHGALLALLHHAIDGNKRYPTIARRQQRQGVATVLFRLHPDGALDRLELADSSGFDMLDQAALRAVAGVAPFEPAMRLLTRDAEFRVEVEFRLF